MPNSLNLVENPFARYALSETLWRDMPASGLQLIPRAKEGDVLIPPYTGSKDPKAAIRFLTLWILWSLQLGFSPDLTKQLLEEYIKIAFSLPCWKVCKTWRDYSEYFYQRHRIPGGAAKFHRWYDKRAKKVAIVWFSYAELERATDAFTDDKRVGQGSAGVVYKGLVEVRGQSDVPVAIKTLKDPRNKNLPLILEEVALHRESTKATHPDVVQLVGFCSNADNPLLGFEFVGGNLRHHLEGLYDDHLGTSLAARLFVAIDIANAIAQLHYRGSFAIFHKDIRLSNILIDGEWQARLGDLGMALGVKPGVKPDADRVVPPVAKLGSQGYMDPVYEYTGELHDKTDVFSFGVVILELVSLMKVWDPTRREKSLVDLVVTRMKGAHPYSVIKNRGQAIAPGQTEQYDGEGILRTMLHVGVWCCLLDLEKRPTILEVAEYLEELRRCRPRLWKMDDRLVGARYRRGCLGWDWDHPTSILSPKGPD